MLLDLENTFVILVLEICEFSKECITDNTVRVVYCLKTCFSTTTGSVQSADLLLAWQEKVLYEKKLDVYNIL